ncbi:sugar ABC transporter permease [Candidatus Bipolaricaulota bacterium]|nr:sugar ABC transporter permease [Candidatus Bipolaricaulota bacterium]
MTIPPRLRSRRYWLETGQAYLYLLPALAVLGVFVFYPFFNAFNISFHKVYLVKRVGGRLIPLYMEYVGLSNFTRLFGDPIFIKAIRQTSIYVGVSVPITIGLALVLATLLNEGLRLRPFYRLAYFMPYITPVVAIAMVWQWIYNWKYGLLNYFLGFFGVDLVNWLNDPRFSLAAVIIMNVWRFVGYQAIILLAGMQGIDRMYYEAAKVDGATGLQAWRKITIPLLTPQIFFVLIISLIGSFKIFEEVLILFNNTPGPLYSAMTMVYYIFDQGFNRFHFGRAAAASVVLFGIIFLLTLFQMTVTQRRVHYER